MSEEADPSDILKDHERIQFTKQELDEYYLVWQNMKFISDYVDAEVVINAEKNNLNLEDLLKLAKENKQNNVKINNDIENEKDLEDLDKILGINKK